MTRASVLGPVASWRSATADWHRRSPEPMSPTMLLGRIVLPVFGLSLTALLIWQVAATGSAQLPPLMSLPSRDPYPSKEPATDPGPNPAAGPAQVVAEGRVVTYPGAE